MIQNQHQYQVTQNKLLDLERGLVELEKIKDTLHHLTMGIRVCTGSANAKKCLLLWLT